MSTSPVPTSTYMLDARIQIEAVSEDAAEEISDQVIADIERIAIVDAVYVDDVRPITE